MYKRERLHQVSIELTQPVSRWLQHDVQSKQPNIFISIWNYYIFLDQSLINVFLNWHSYRVKQYYKKKYCMIYIV